MSDKPIGFDKSGACAARHGRHKASIERQKTGLPGLERPCLQWLTAN
jgi:hypothetical protein